MKKSLLLLVLAVLAGSPCGVQAAWRKNYTEVIEFNKTIQGRVLDYTDNHGKDRRIWSRALGQRRDMYVYLPPGFDPHKRYPLAIFLHSMGQDEQLMFTLAPLIDHSIWVGDLPPMIVAVPDGTVRGVPDWHQTTFFLNSNLGDFEDYLLTDVWDYLMANFPIRPEREAHILAGVSTGGFAAYSIGLRNRCTFATLIGIHPFLNVRWSDECCNYRAKFNPYHWGWRTAFTCPTEVIGYSGAHTVHVGQVIEPLYASPGEAIYEASRNNPIELVERTCLREGELQMYVAYGAKDEFNVDSQVESFFYLCKFKKLYVGIGYDCFGHHDLVTATRLWPGIVTWLKPRITVKELPSDSGTHSNVAMRIPQPNYPMPPMYAMQPAYPGPMPPWYPVPPFAVQPAPAPNSGTQAAPPTPPAIEIAAVNRPQPMTTYWTPRHFAPPSQPSMTGGTNAVEETQPFATTLPDIAASPLGEPTAKGNSSRSAMRPPPPSRADLGPPARSGVAYGVWDKTPDSPPPQPQP